MNGPIPGRFHRGDAESAEFGKELGDRNVSRKGAKAQRKRTNFRTLRALRLGETKSESEVRHVREANCSCHDAMPWNRIRFCFI